MNDLAWLFLKLGFMTCGRPASDDQTGCLVGGDAVAGYDASFAA